jgi:hypothetical protein
LPINSQDRTAPVASAPCWFAPKKKRTFMVTAILRLSLSRLCTGPRLPRNGTVAKHQTVCLRNKKAEYRSVVATSLKSVFTMCAYPRQFVVRTAPGGRRNHRHNACGINRLRCGDADASCREMALKPSQNLPKSAKKCHSKINNSSLANRRLACVSGHEVRHSVVADKSI